jgi:branched-subunit amino acid transport protein
VRDALPFTIVVIPFAILFGVVGTEAGLNLAQVMGFSVVVIAGASQFAALQLMSENAPTLIVVASALAVNLRMAMYSAALAPHLGPASLKERALIAYMTVDQSYALSVQRYEDAPGLSHRRQGRLFPRDVPAHRAAVVHGDTGRSTGRNGDPGVLGSRIRGPADISCDHCAGAADACTCGRGTQRGDGGPSSGMDALEPWALVRRTGRHGRRRRDRAAHNAQRRAAAQGCVMSYTDAQIWGIIALLGVGTFLVRFSFLGLVGKRELPEWLLRHLRYTAVAILPAMVAPLILWPPANDGVPEASRMAAAAVTVAIGVILKNPILGIVAGFCTFLGLGALG